MRLFRLVLVLAGAVAVAYVLLSAVAPEQSSKGLSGLLNRSPMVWTADPEDPWAAYLAPDGVCPKAGDSSRTVTEQQRTMVCLINYARRQKGLVAVKSNDKLAKATQLKAALIVRCGEFSHTPCRTAFADVFRESGYGEGATFASVGENLAYGEDEEGSPLATLSNWLHSPEHRQNLFTPKWRVQGLAMVRPDSFLNHEGISLWVSAFGVSG